MSRAKSPFRRLAAALAILALLALGFAHAPLSAPQVADPALVAYLQSGGAITDLCLGNGDMPTEQSRDCPVCTLCKTMAIAEAAPEPGLPAAIAHTNFPSHDQDLGRTDTTRAPPVRGPPAILV